MNTPSANAKFRFSREPRACGDQVGVCYHCRETVWDGQEMHWNAPHACPYCQQPLTLVLQPQHRSRAEAVD